VTPIATYRERRFDGRRDFSLYTDRLEVSGKQTPGAEFTSTFNLGSLDPHLNRIRKRDPGFVGGIWMVLISFGLLQSHTVSFPSNWSGLTAVMGVAGLLLSIATLRRIHWATFRSVAGVELVSIARSGPDASSFEEFLERMANQIRAASSGSSEESGVVA
jgi:hypothetical protein